MNRSLETKYKRLLHEIIRDGVHRNDRTGVGSSSLFSKTLEFNFDRGTLPIITGRKMYHKIWDAEYDWFMAGHTNIKELQEKGVTIWNEWADKNGDLGPVYGHQLRNWNSKGIDQLKSVIESLRSDPDSRRHIISLWNPEQLPDMKLPPCYNYFQFFVDKDDKLNLFVNMRSADLFLGVPYDLMLFTRILFYVAGEAGYMIPGKLKLHMTDVHVYDNQLEAVEEFMSQPIYDELRYHYDDENHTIEYIDSKEHNKKVKSITAPVAV